MTRQEHLLTILSEECMEVAQRCSKAIRFGLSEVQPGQPLSNSERITEEFADLLAVFEILNREAGIQWPISLAIQNKKNKVDKFMGYSQQCGTLAKGKEENNVY